MSGAGTYRTSIGWAPIADLIVNPSPDQIAAAAGPAPGPEDWRDDALCSQVDSEIFFPPKGGSIREAKSVCAACPVKAACGEWALDHPAETEFGVWAGMPPRERQRIRAQRALAAAA